MYAHKRTCMLTNVHVCSQMYMYAHKQIMFYSDLPFGWAFERCYVFVEAVIPDLHSCKGKTTPKNQAALQCRYSFPRT